jgi:hypothetical protein
MESCCERGNETSGSMKCWESTEWPLEFDHKSLPLTLIPSQMKPVQTSSSYSSAIRYNIPIADNVLLVVSFFMVSYQHFTCNYHYFTLSLQCVLKSLPYGHYGLLEHDAV